MKVFEIAVMDEPVRVGDDRPVEFKKVVTDEDSQQRRVLHVLTKIHQEVQKGHYWEIEGVKEVVVSASTSEPMVCIFPENL